MAMKKYFLSSLLILIVILGLGFLSQRGVASSAGQQVDEQVVRGGQLYDNWTKLVTSPPDAASTHPI